MSRTRFYSPPDFRFDGGQQDTAAEDGLELPLCRLVQNFRIGEGVAKRRKGMQRFARASLTNSAPNLDGSTDYYTVNLDTRVHTLKKAWTFEALVKPDTFTVQRPIWDVAHAADYSLRVYVTTAGKVEAKVQDSAATVTTLTSATTYSTSTTLAIQVVRDGTALTLRVNGATEDSHTMADLNCLAPGGRLYIGRDNSANLWDGVIDFVRCLGVVLPDQRYGMIRWPYPRAEAVLWDYEMEEENSATDRCNDRSRFENHATSTSDPSYSTANALCAQSQPVFCIAPFVNNDAKQFLLSSAGNYLYPAELVR